MQRFKISPHVSEAADGSATPATQIDSHQLAEIPVARIDENQVLEMHFYPQCNVGYFFWIIFCYAGIGNANAVRRVYLN